MVEKYDSAAVRHYEDAELLRDSGRLDNAGHLVGFAAECAIKHGISTFNSGLPSPYGHLPKFLRVAVTHLKGRGRNPNSALFEIVKGNIFSDWNVDQRYCETGTILKEELDVWFKVTRRLIGAAGIKERK